jgi:UDP-N-acetylmuramoyl-L-alanine---L-glutamate ligase
MRPTLSWADLPGRRVGLYGLGREGEANLRTCRALGVDPVLVDDAPAGRALAGAVVLATSGGGFEALLGCDVVVKSPGISPYGEVVSALVGKGTPVPGGLGLWLQGADRSRVVCLTGTKGKSTTTAIIGHLLRGLGQTCLVGGNIGVPPWDPLVVAASPEPDWWVVEVSSYQACDVATSPPVVAVTSLHPDHLPWHGGDVETYYRDKLSLCSRPGAELTVANGDSPLIRSRAGLLGPRVEWVRETDEPEAIWMAPLRLLGGHNRRNALIARAVLRALGVRGAEDDAVLATAAAGFEPLPSRLTPAGRRGGVEFVDDGLSTNVLATLAAVDAFADRRVALLVGGQSRGIDYAPLAVGLREREADLLLVTMPDNGDDIRAAVESTGAGPRVAQARAGSLEQAVRTGFTWARPDGVVLLSPAAPSFGRYRDYADRGRAFAAAVAGLE